MCLGQHWKIVSCFAKLALLKISLLSCSLLKNVRQILLAVSMELSSVLPDLTFKGPDHYYIRGASVKAISALFGAYIFQSIDESELRNWEKENGQLETTDCVEMQLLRDPTSRHGILKLRIGWRLGNPIVNSLYT